jgi:hydroxymethylbilane synthase
MPKLRLATRKSKLALAQARAFYRELQSLHANAGGEALEVDELHVVTSGDKFVDRPLQALGGKGLFIKEIEEAMLAGQADIAVHSIKDVPAELADNLVLAAIPERNDPRDVIVTRSGAPLAELPQGATVGTSSLRRKLMLLRTRPDLSVGPLRGNVDTRLRKLEDGEVDAIVLAYAGLRRLDMADRATEVLEPEAMLPAVGQGALGIECRADNDAVRELLQVVVHDETRIRVAAERAFMAAVGGSCQLPVAAYAVREGDEIWLRAMCADDDGSNPRFGERRGTWSADANVAESEAGRMGVDLGHALR